MISAQITNFRLKAELRTSAFRRNYELPPSELRTLNIFPTVCGCWLGLIVLSKPKLEAKTVTHFLNTFDSRSRRMLYFDDRSRSRFDHAWWGIRPPEHFLTFGKLLELGLQSRRVLFDNTRCGYFFIGLRAVSARQQRIIPMTLD